MILFIVIACHLVVQCHSKEELDNDHYWEFKNDNLNAYL